MWPIAHGVQHHRLDTLHNINVNVVWDRASGTFHSRTSPPLPGRPPINRCRCHRDGERLAGLPADNVRAPHTSPRGGCRGGSPLAARQGDCGRPGGLCLALARTAERSLLGRSPQPLPKEQRGVRCDEIVEGTRLRGGATIARHPDGHRPTPVSTGHRARREERERRSEEFGGRRIGSQRSAVRLLDCATSTLRRRPRRPTNGNTMSARQPPSHQSLRERATQHRARRGYAQPHPTGTYTPHPPPPHPTTRQPHNTIETRAGGVGGVFSPPIR